MKSILSKYTAEYEGIKSKSPYDFLIVQSFVAKLLAFPPTERYELLPLFKRIENDVWEQGVMLPNLSYEELLKEKAAWEAAPKVVLKKEKKSEKIDDLNSVLIDFFSKYYFGLNRVKGYFLFLADNSENSPTKVRIIYDEEFNKHPEINSFNNETQFDLEKIKLKEFSDLIATKDEVRNQKYLLVFLIGSHLKDNKQLINSLENILNLFDRSNYISVNKKPLTSDRDFNYKPIQDGLRIISNYSSKVFNNRELTLDEEIIIKLFFPGDEMILDYKILKKGNSGSKVIEVQPFKGGIPDMSRFVVKYSKIDSDRKIQDEWDKFRIWVRNKRVDGYMAELFSTDSHDAILYSYASSDSRQNSYPFAELVTDRVFEKNKYNYALDEIVEDLFNCAPYRKWDENREEITESVEVLYKEYLSSESKVIDTVSKIKGESQISNLTEFIDTYEKIKKIKLRTYRKICHGDLHSENFFKDEQGVYLIDFGWTNQHHSLIDHATLECSLKFKHLPFYIPIDELIECETKLLSIDSFTKSFDLSFVKRQSLLEVCKLIIQIRENAKQHMLDSSNPLEYLISLFIINFRQIQYPDLNQAYALAAAEVLSRKIIELIK